MGEVGGEREGTWKPREREGLVSATVRKSVTKGRGGPLLGSNQY